MPGEMPSAGQELRAAEVVAALCLATDLGMGLPFEHGLHSTLVAMRLCERLGVDRQVAAETFYGCLLFYAGCTADAEVAAELFDDGALLAHFTPVMFGTRAQTMLGVVRALAGPGPVRMAQGATRLPRAIGGHRRHLAAMCEVAQMLTDRLGLPNSVRDLFVHFTERWDGKGEPARLRADEIPLPVRVVQVARDAAFQGAVGGEAHAVEVIRSRAGGAFDPAVAATLVEHATDVLSHDDATSAWDGVLAAEPAPWVVLEGEAIDRALAAVGDFADLVSPYLAGHAAGVSALAAAAASRSGLPADDVVAVRRAALVQDVGRVAVPTRIWQKPASLSSDDWEKVRLHAYQSERVLCRSPFLATLAPVAASHHERGDGSGYHRGIPAAALGRSACLLAAADAYQAMTEPRPHREPLSAPMAAEELGRDARAGRLDAVSVAAVLEAAGHRPPRLARPAGLTEREAQVVALLARGLLTKQIGRALGISAKTADRHVQNAYAKIGVSTRAAAALFAMEHGLITWGELPVGRTKDRS